LIVLGAIVLVTMNILPQKESLGIALRSASFSVLTMQTCTGYATDDFNLYPEFSRLLLFALVFIGASAGSTAGGLKIARLIVVARGIANEVLRRFRPHAVLVDRVGPHPIDRDVVRSVYVYFAAFSILFAGATLVMTSMGLDIVSAATAVVTCMSNCGPGLGLVGPTRNFAFIPSMGKIFLPIVMILGRLEIFTVVALLMPSFWRR
jgi:trk system potassium uptake protein TrkH